MKEEHQENIKEVQDCNCVVGEEMCKAMLVGHMKKRVMAEGSDGGGSDKENASPEESPCGSLMGGTSSGGRLSVKRQCEEGTTKLLQLLEQQDQLQSHFLEEQCRTNLQLVEQHAKANEESCLAQEESQCAREDAQAVREAQASTNQALLEILRAGLLS
ncbi:hypothetical protein K439DRAFT_1617810 [Ramaria rubella]|nr:hypothetical protein K439DRAFT_1617810 [Ramaria rubella]